MQKPGFDSELVDKICRAALRQYGLLSVDEMKDLLRDYMPGGVLSTRDFMKWLEKNKGQKYAFLPDGDVMVCGEFTQFAMCVIGSRKLDRGAVAFDDQAAFCLIFLRDRRGEYGRKVVPLEKLLEFAEEDFVTRQPFSEPLRKLIDEMPEIMTSLRTKDLEQTLEYFYFLLQVIGVVRVQLDSFLIRDLGATGKKADKIRRACRDFMEGAPLWIYGGQTSKEMMLGDGPQQIFRNTAKHLEEGTAESIEPILLLMHARDPDIFEGIGPYLTSPDKIALWNRIRGES